MEHQLPARRHQGVAGRDGGQTRTQVLHNRIDETQRSLGDRIDETNRSLSETHRSLSNRIDETNKRIDTHFRWIMGTLVTLTGVLIAVIKL